MGRTVEIVVYTKPEVLSHKKREGKRSEGRYCYWRLSSPPRKLCDVIKNRIQGDVVVLRKSEARLYFAIKGFIRGFFDIYGIKIDSGELWFYSESWMPIKPIPQKPFQGFKYLKGAS